MVSRVARLAFPVLLALLTTLAAPAGAAAHALLVASDPAAGASLPSAPSAVTLTFSEEPDPRLSQIKVLDTSGAASSSGEVSAVPGKSNELRVSLGALNAGVYTVAWRTVSAVDGHLATGSFAFAVGVPVPSGSGIANPSPAGFEGSSGLSVVAVLGRWLLYVGLIGLLGASVIALFVVGGLVARLSRVLSIAWLAAAAGTALVIGSQVADAGVSLGQAFASSLGASLTLRVAPVLVAGLAVLVAWRPNLPRPPLLWVITVAAASAMLADSLGSHAAAGPGVLGTAAPLNVAVQWLHIAATGVWLGGLVMLLVSLRGRPSERTRMAAGRFANVAAVGIGLVSATGLLRAVAELTSLDQLVTTGFGLLLVAKTALLLGLAGLGALNHFRNVPMAGRSLTGLRRVGSVEIALGATVLVLSASLVNLAPPVDSVAAHSHGGTNGGELVATGHDFGTSVQVRLAVDPGAVGANTFSATITDFDTGAPADASAVTLRFALPARPDVGASQLLLKPVTPGVFTATGTNLSLEGSWDVTALVQLASGAVEVDLHITTHGAAAAPRVDVSSAPDQPTIYTVHFASGQSVQLYLDPGKAGANEVHITYFDAKGNEAPVSSTTLSLRRSGSPVLTPKPRILEPGHFVADARLEAGMYTLAFSGTPPGGQALSAQLEVKVLP
jgi:copper transport protein